MFSSTILSRYHKKQIQIFLFSWGCEGQQRNYRREEKEGRLLLPMSKVSNASSVQLRHSPCIWNVTEKVTCITWWLRIVLLIDWKKRQCELDTQRRSLGGDAVLFRKKEKSAVWGHACLALGVCLLWRSKLWGLGQQQQQKQQPQKQQQNRGSGPSQESEGDRSWRNGERRYEWENFLKTPVKTPWQTRQSPWDSTFTLTPLYHCPCNSLLPLLINF